MITRDEAYDIISNINENAHDRSWDTWVESDQLLESDEEADWEAGEELREEASKEQAEYFREEFDELDEETRETILHYVRVDEDFKEEFAMWYGEDEFRADFD